MGFLDFFSRKSSAPEETILKLPQGTFTVDRQGKVITSTLPSSFPARHVNDIAQAVLEIFRGAQECGTALNEVTVQYPALKVTAREQRGGAMIYLSPKALSATTR